MKPDGNEDWVGDDITKTTSLLYAVFGLAFLVQRTHDSSASLLISLALFFPLIL